MLLPGWRGTSLVLLSSVFIPKGNMESGNAGAEIVISFINKKMLFSSIAKEKQKKLKKKTYFNKKQKC